MEQLNATQMIRDDHKRLIGLLRQAEAVPMRAQEMETLVYDELLSEFASHSRVKQEVFYPEVAALAQRTGETSLFGLIDQGFENLSWIDQTIRELRTMDKHSEDFHSRFNELSERIDAHFVEEEQEILKRVEGLGEGLSPGLAPRMLEVRSRMMAGIPTIQAPNGGEQKRTGSAG